MLFCSLGEEADEKASVVSHFLFAVLQFSVKRSQLITEGVRERLHRRVHPDNSLRGCQM